MTAVKSSGHVRARLAFLLPDMKGGGAERVALTLIRAFVERGHAVDLLLMDAGGDLLQLVPKPVRVINLKASRVRSVVRPLARYLKQENPSALQVSMWPLTVAAIVARALSRASTRLVVSDHAALSKQYAKRGLLHRQFLKWTIRLFYPSADARVVVAANTAKDLARLSGLPQSSFEVIYNPVDPAVPRTRNPEIEHLWGGSDRRILNVGRLDPQKNQILLLEAFARLSAKCEARLVILGEGVLRGALERRAAELRIADRVAMPGFRLDVASVYGSADLFVLSSDYEGFGNVLVEAMLAGVPVVSTNCEAGPSEILDGGRYGRLVPVGDADALAEAMLETLQKPIAPAILRARAQELTLGVCDAYERVMLPRYLLRQ